MEINKEVQKINEKRIQWIIREIKKGRKITEIARIQSISRVRVWQLYRHYIGEGEIPEFKKPRAKKRKIGREEREFIIEMHERYRLGAVALEKKMERMYMIHIPHNRIYSILLEERKEEEKTRKYV